MLRAGVGWWPGAVGTATGHALGESFVGYVARSEEPVVSDDVTADPRFRISAFLARHGPVSAAGVVVAGRDRPYGVLAAFSRRRRSFSPDDVSFLQAVANVVSGAAEREGDEQRLRQVRDDERRRIARDLHDHALQELTDALAVASAAGGLAGAQPATVLVPALKRAGEQLRAAIYDLRLGGGARSFVDLLHELVELQRRAWTGGVIQLEVADTAPAGTLGDEGVEVLLVVREALVNARRHSGASTVRVVVSGSAGQLRVEVRDDGVGFAPSSPADGTGIAGMRERIALLGGRLELGSGPGAGTSVGLDVPLRGEEPR